MKIAYVGIDEIETGCFAVYVTIPGGKFLYHEGPKDYAYFTKEQAEKLASRVQASGFKIDLSRWDDGRFYRDDRQREEVSLEDAYYDRLAA
jgi:hypothetical protein